MNFLKKLGSALLKVTQIVTGFGPLVASVVPQSSGAINVVTSDLQQIAGVIGTAEAMGQAINAPGTQKLTMAAPLVAQIINQSALMVGKKIADPAAFQKACEGIASNMADLLNSLHDSGVQTTSLT